jgi:hypothetical protein
VSRRFHVRAGAFHQRSGANQISALDASLVTQFGARMHLYFILVGVGPYYRRMPRGSADCDPASSLTACPELEDISALGVAITNGVQPSSAHMQSDIIYTLGIRVPLF